MPCSKDPDVLGHELKVRLATCVPVLEESVGSNGLYQFTELPATTRQHVTIYEITDEDDLYKLCSFKVPKVTTPEAIVSVDGMKKGYMCRIM